jgi:hypothetical protein
MAINVPSGLGVSDMWKQINAQNDANLYAQMAQQLEQAQIVGTAVPPSRHSLPTSNGTLASRAREMFLKRMGGIRNEMMIHKDDFLQCHVYGEVVHVFYCFGGRTGVAQESIDLFPSDQFITQFRIILS